MGMVETIIGWTGTLHVVGVGGWINLVIFILSLFGLILVFCLALGEHRGERHAMENKYTAVHVQENGNTIQTIKVPFGAEHTVNIRTPFYSSLVPEEGPSKC